MLRTQNTVILNTPRKNTISEPVWWVNQPVAALHYLGRSIRLVLHTANIANN
jgi:hypothetical protein